MTEATTTGRIAYREEGDANHYAVLAEDGRWLLSLLHNGEATTERQRANLRRLAACWNACEGIDAAALERVGMGLWDLAPKLQADRDRMLSAIMAATNALNGDPAGAEGAKAVLSEALAPKRAPRLDSPPGVGEAREALDWLQAGGQVHHTHLAPLRKMVDWVQQMQASVPSARGLADTPSDAQQVGASAAAGYLATANEHIADAVNALHMANELANPVERVLLRRAMRSISEVSGDLLELDVAMYDASGADADQ